MLTAQALFYNLRVIREEWGGNKRQMMQSRAAAARKAAEAQALAARSATPASAPPPQPATPAADGQAPAAATTPQAANANANGSTNGDGDVEMKEVKEEAASSNGGQNGTPVAPSATLQPKAPPLPLDYVDEIINMLKTAFPLLALMMEKMVDHISIRAKPNSEEDIYRFFAALLNDAMQVSHSLFHRPSLLPLLIS